jgi:diguanylate cyclase (GGDEF)-like protein
VFISLRYKFTLALLVGSMFSTVLIIGIAYARLKRKFDDLVLQSAVQSFRQDVSSYFHTYGSWEEAQRREDFPSFSDRRRQKVGMPVIRGLDRAVWLEGKNELEMEPLESVTPQVVAENLRRPPFRFYLFDPQKRALLPLEPYRVGEPMHPGKHERLLPIESDGRVVAYFSPEGSICYSDLDLGYLAAMREAMIYGSGIAMLLTLGLGLTLGSKLSADLRRLTVAIEAMEQGELKQHVVVHSRDEVDVLAKAFNRMSEELTRSHEEVRQANEQVRQQTEQLKELSVRDELTKLHNRRFFDEQAEALFEQAVRYERPFTVAIGDIDFFKRINDNFSHALGDEVLRRVSEILRSQVRAVDVLARYGGEEFVIAFPETPLRQAVAVCERLGKDIREYAWCDLDPDLHVTMSMGVCGDSHIGSFEAMLKAADTLLYRAKALGRDRVCVDEPEG